VLTKDIGNNTHVWDATTGQLLADAPIPAIVAPAALSPDGRWEAVIDRNSVHLMDRRWTRPLLPPRVRPGAPDPGWHAEQAQHAKKDKQWFAAGFHLSKLADAQPWDASTRLREALAWAQAHRPARAALAFTQAVLTDPRVVPR
jgi:hypothetical protein